MNDSSSEIVATPCPRFAADWDALLARPTASLVAEALALFDEQEAWPYPAWEYDRVMGLGARLARTMEPRALGGAAVRWLVERPTERRLGIASAFLIGLCRHTPSLPRLAEADAAVYRALVESTPHLGEADSVAQSLRALAEGR